jgi:hypothetical protein
VPLDPDTIALRAEVHDALEEVLRRGRQDGTIRPDVTAFDMIVFGALLAQPLPGLPNWKSMARRQAAIYFDGLGGTAMKSSLPKERLSRTVGPDRPNPCTSLTSPNPRHTSEAE